MSTNRDPAINGIVGKTSAMRIGDVLRTRKLYNSKALLTA